MRWTRMGSVVGVAVLVVVAGCSSTETQRVESSGSQGSLQASSVFSVPSSPSVSELQRLISSSVKVDYAPYYSLRSMAEASDVVVKGRIRGVREGRRLYHSRPVPGDPRADEPYLSMLILDIDVDAVLGGARPDILKGKYYFESDAPLIADPGKPSRVMSAEEYAAFLPPDAPVILFAVRFDPDADPEGRARVEGAEPGAVYLTPHVQGYLMEEAGSVVVMSGEPLPGGPKASLVEVESELVAAQVQGKVTAGPTP